jgi:hypothetical protein
MKKKDGLEAFNPLLSFYPWTGGNLALPTQSRQ